VLSSPVLSNINSKYTNGSPTGDYNAMTVQVVSNKIAVTISFSGNGDGTGDLLSTSNPDGERICTITLDISNTSANANLSWDQINSAMNTPTYQALTNTYSGSDVGVLPVELASFTAEVKENNVLLKWETATEIQNYGWEVERKMNNQKVNSTENWLKIGFIHGNSSSNSPKEYSFRDKGIKLSGEYLYRLKQMDLDGSIEYSDNVSVRIKAPLQHSIEQNYPNPFNPSTKIKFTLPDRSRVNLSVYNFLGEKIAEVVNDELDAGYHSVEWNATNVPSGIYFCSLSAGSFHEVKKMILIK